MPHLELTHLLPAVQDGPRDEAARQHAERLTREGAHQEGLPRFSHGHVTVTAIAVPAIAVLGIAGLAVFSSSALPVTAIACLLAYVAGVVWIFGTAEEPGGPCDRLDDMWRERERASRR